MQWMHLDKHTGNDKHDMIDISHYMFLYRQRLTLTSLPYLVLCQGTLAHSGIGLSRIGLVDARLDVSIR